jgi:hypothetical protein
MKKLAVILFAVLASSLCYSQNKVQIKADSVYIQKDGSNAELILLNGSRNVQGYLYNKGGGRTTFKVPLFIDSIWVTNNNLSWRVNGVNYSSNINTQSTTTGTSDGNNYTSNVTFNGSNYTLTTSRNSLPDIVTDITHTHLQSDITGLSDSLLSKANIDGSNATGTWNVSVSGNAATVTNGLYSTGSYSNPSWLTTLAWSKLTGIPTTVSGYGITDAVVTSGSYTNPAWITSIPYSKITSTPTTVSGYGITDGVSTSGSYSNPSWITSLAYSKLTGTPTNVSTFTNDAAYLTSESDPIFVASVAHGISGTDTTHWNNAYNKKVTNVSFSGTATKTLTITYNDGTTVTGSFTDDNDGTGTGASAGVTSYAGRNGTVVPIAGDYTFAMIGSTPTTLAGYGITDAAPLSHTHTFASLTSKPTTISGYGITDAVSTSGSYANPTWITSLAYSKLTSVPTTTSGFGITDAVSTLTTYSNPAWITGLAWSKILTTPTTLTGYGITDAVNVNSSYTNPSWLVSIPFTKITSKPTTLAGYGITDAIQAHTAIIAATHTKITYNTDGTVASGTDITAADIPSGINANKINTGTITNGEYNTLNGSDTTKTIQAQINNKQGLLTAGVGIQIVNNVISAIGNGSSCGQDIMAVWSNNFGSTISIPASGTKYTAAIGNNNISDTETTKIIVAPASGVIKNLFVFAKGTQPSSGTLTITVKKGISVSAMANTTLSVTIAANSAAGTGTVYSNTTSTVAVNAGDLISIKLGNTATATSLNISDISLVYSN